MAHLLIWGATRDLVEGALTASIQAEHVTTLAELREALGPSGLALVLADPACLDAERTAVEAWLLEGGSAQAVLMAVAHPADADQVLQRLPFVDDIILRPLSAVRLRLKLSRALETVQSRRVVRQLEDALGRKNEDLKRKSQDLSVLNDIGVKLSAERDLDKLLALILSKSREITSADAGSLYLVKRAEEGNGGRDQLQFMLPQNDTLGVGQFERVTMPLDESSLAGYTAVTGEVQNVPDAYEHGAGSAGSRAFDERSGYRTKSMLVIPMRDHKNEVIGVVQLINKKRSREAVLRPLSLVDEIVIPFDKTDEELVGSLASQAAVAFENADLIQRIRQLFDDFILAAVRAVELRDPTTEGHSRRVAILTVELATKVDATSSGRLAAIRLNRDQMEELRYAALLHDFGKVAVEEKYLKKEKKLYATELIALRQRFAYIARANEAKYLQRQLDLLRNGGGSAERLALLESDYRRRKAEIEQALAIVLRANEPTVVDSEEFLRAIERLEARPFVDHKEEERFPVEEWAEGPFLTSDEKHALLIKKGSLTRRERDKINEHVTHTYDFLRKIPWTSEFRRIPDIAHAHHEKLNGTGYPRRLQAPEIPPQSRMMTIADIFDALVAIDRPYKDPISTETALRILDGDMRRGELDDDLLRVFIEAKVYEHPDFKSQLRRRS